MSAIRSRLGALAALVLLVACGNDRRLPSILDPNISEQGLRDVLGVPDSAKRVLILSQSSHLDINWKKTFDQYYADHVERVFLDAEAVLESDAKAYYSVAEMGFLSEHVARHGSAPWRKHATAKPTRRTPTAAARAWREAPAMRSCAAATSSASTR